MTHEVIYRRNPATGRIEPFEIVATQYDGDGEIVGETVDAEATAVLNSPETKRRRDYEVEADPVRDRALSYREEAAAWRRRGEEAKAAAADALADAALDEYLEKKEEIRARYPERPAVSAIRYYLTGSGAYHREGCVYTTAAGEWLTADEILARNAGVRPCSRCGAPDPEALAGEGVNG